MEKLIFSMAVATLLHLLAMAVTAKLFRVKIVELSYGIGPKIFCLSKVSVRLIPFAGSLQMIDSRANEIEESELKYAYDHKSKLTRFLIALSGCAFLLAVGYFSFGKDTTQIFIGSFNKILTGVFSPFGSAQTFIESARGFVLSNSVSTILSATAIYFSAINLLPIPVLNGGQALLEIVDISEKLKGALTVVGVLTFFLMLLSWVSALTIYAWLKFS